MSLNSATQEFVRKAEAVYNDSLKEQLETEHLGSLIALDPETGDYVIGPTFREIDQAAQERFGTRRTHIFRVGGGGAVRIGVGSHARVS